MEWFLHPILAQSYYALTDKYSFLCLKDEAGYETSWQDRCRGGSASSTREGPFKTLDEAKANCERIEKELRRKQ